MKSSKIIFAKFTFLNHNISKGDIWIGYPYEVQNVPSIEILDSNDNILRSYLFLDKDMLNMFYLDQNYYKTSVWQKVEDAYPLNIIINETNEDKQLEEISYKRLVKQILDFERQQCEYKVNIASVIKNIEDKLIA